MTGAVSWTAILYLLHCPSLRSVNTRSDLEVRGILMTGCIRGLFQGDIGPYEGCRRLHLGVLWAASYNPLIRQGV